MWAVVTSGPGFLDDADEQHSAQLDKTTRDMSYMDDMKGPEDESGGELYRRRSAGDWSWSRSSRRWRPSLAAGRCVSWRAPRSTTNHEV